MNTTIRAACVIAMTLCMSFAVHGGAGAQAATPGTEKSRVTFDEARALVFDLPEVKAWRAERRKAADLDPKGPATAGILTGSRNPGGAKHWAVTFYKNPSNQPEKWATFLVRESDAGLFVEDDKGNPIPLEQWRRGHPRPDS